MTHTHDLNPQQLKAVTTKAPHTLVLAGAGSGKTKTIIARASHLIATGTEPKRILILAFTRRAAREIEARVGLTLGRQASHGLNASTFHSWCAHLLRRAPKLFGFTQFSVIDRDDQIQMFRLARGKRTKKEFPSAADICDLYSYARNTRLKLSLALEKLMPEEVDHKEAIAEVMKAYEQRKRSNNYLDYDDILDVVAKGLHQSADIQKWVGQQYDHVLVDEMQDTNPIQWEILRPLADHAKLFCVGDDAQSIYGFRGADFNNVHSFQQRLPNAEVLKLEDNYRSTQEILDVSNWLLEVSPIHYDKKLRAVRGSGIKPVLHTFSSDWQEGRWLAEDIIERHTEGAAWHDHLVLVRSGYAARTIEQAFISAGIPYVLIGGTQLMKAAHIKDVLAVLRVVANYRDEMGWIRYLTMWPGIGDTKASRMIDQFHLLQDSHTCITWLQQQASLPAQANHALQIAAQLQHNVAKLLQAVFQSLEPTLAARYQDSNWSRRKRDFEFLVKLAEGSTSIAEFLEEYVLNPLYDSEVERQEDDDVVTISTIHSAKGTERQVCYIADVSVGSYPSLRAVENAEEVEEERRVLYVAMTRAKDELILLRSNTGRYSPRHTDHDDRLIESYFLNDLPSELVDEVGGAAERSSGDSAVSNVQGQKIEYGMDFD